MPDLIVNFPRHELKTDGFDPYVYLFTEHEFTEHLWIRGFDWNFTNKKFIHHAIAFELGPGFPKPPGKIYDALKVGFPARRSGAGAADYLPGSGPRFYPKHAAMLIPKGAVMYGVFHYAPTTQSDTWGRPQLGLYLANGAVKRPYMRLDLTSDDILIQPGDSTYTQIISGIFPMDAYVSDFHIHMHNRGKSGTINITYSDGKKENLFSIPNFNFDWQRHYYLKEPKLIPAGTKAEFIAVWDNSADNPNNPDPTATVEYGSLTQNEMGNANITYTSTTDLPNTIVVENGRKIGLAQLADKVRVMYRAEVLAFLQSLSADQAVSIRGIWEKANGEL